MRKRVYPLRVHLAMLVAGVLLPVMVLFALAVVKLAAYQREQTDRRLNQAAHDLSDSLDRDLEASMRALSTLAESQRLEAGDLAGFHITAQRAMHAQINWYTVILLTPDGRQVLNAQVPFGEALPQPADIESLERVASTGEPAIGNLKASQRDGTLGFALRVPVRIKGEVRYVLTAVIKPESMRDLLQLRPEESDEWTRTILDAGGTVVARTRSHEQFVGMRATQQFLDHMKTAPSGTYRAVTPDGLSAYLAYSKAPASGWTCSVVVPVDVIDGNARRTLWTVIAVGAGLTVASAIGAFVFSRKVSRGIASASSAAATLATGGVPETRYSTITEIRELNESLDRSAELLSQRERERSELLVRAQAAQAQAETANRAKDEFLAMLGHELRNPLAPIRSGAHLLKTLPPGDPKLMPIHDAIDRQVTHMTRMVDDLLDASRVARGRMNVQKQVLDIGGVIGEVMADFAGQYAQAGIELAAAESPGERVYIEGDHTRIAQCLGNLLHNALKFTPRGGQVSIGLAVETAVEGSLVPAPAVDGVPQYTYKPNQRARIMVRDTGVGIPMDLLPTLFVPFSQGPQSISRSHGGLGLGLALVKGFVELHGGTVEVHSAGLRSGATFTIRLPLTARRPVAGETHAAADAPAALRVLLVEDLLDAANTLKLVLEFESHKVQIAGTAAAALAAAPAFLPQVVICDIGLPDMDGYALCRRLRAMPELKSARMIALTGYGQADDILRAKEAGFDKHLTKPVDVPALLKAVTGAAGETAVGNLR